MPIPSDYQQIVQALAEKTDQGKVAWKMVRFGIEVAVEDSRFRIWSGTDEETGNEFVSFALMDAQGSGIDSWYVDEGEREYEFMLRLFNAAKRHANGVPQRLAKLTQLLVQAPTIGNPDDKK